MEFCSFSEMANANKSSNPGSDPYYDDYYYQQPPQNNIKAS